MLSTCLTRLSCGHQTTTQLLTAKTLPSTLLRLYLVPVLHSLLEQLPHKFCLPALVSDHLRTSASSFNNKSSTRTEQAHVDSNQQVLCEPSAVSQEHSLCAQEANRGSDPVNSMLPFPNQGNRGIFYQPVPMPVMNPMLMQQQQFISYPMQMGFNNGGMMNHQAQFKGRGFRGTLGGPRVPQFNQGPRQSQPQQQYPQDNDNRNRNSLKRKSSDHDLGARKVGRFQGPGAEPLNSSRSSFDTSTSTSMHMPLVNGAKPIRHVPGQPCEKITEAIVQYYNDFHQSEEDLKHKIVLSKCLYAIVRDIFPGCRLFIVGSSLSGFGTHTSDMDLCLLVSQIHAIDQKNEAVHILNAIHKSLRSCTFIRSSQVIRAKVPILKFTDSKKGIECDLNINNGVGIRNTHLLKYYCLADPRVAPLMLFIKFWARFHDINDAHKRTISSYSLALMLIHYLQVCTPPVLPCLQKLYPYRFDMNSDVRNLRLDEPLQELKSKNTDSLGKLFQGFLDYYAFEFRPELDVISIREGRVLNRHMVLGSSREPMQWKFLCIEEPFDMSNTARSVFDHYIFQRIRHVFQRSAEVLRQHGDVSAILNRPF